MLGCLALEEGPLQQLLAWDCRLSEPAGLHNGFLPAPFLGAAASFAASSNPVCTLLQ